MQRFAVFGLALAAVGCGNNKSKLDVDRGAEVDGLWDLAPDGTQLGIVASGRGMTMATRAVAAARQLATLPDFAAAKPQLDRVMTGLFGGADKTPADAGFATDRPLAVFVTKDGVLAIVPVADRDKFVAAKAGTRGDIDKIAGNSCKPVGDHYVCVSGDAMYARIGKGSLKGKPAIAGARGDIELFAGGFSLLGDTKGDLAVIAQLDGGEVAVRGKWTGAPGGVLAKMIGVKAPKVDVSGASGFVALDLAALLADLPPIPLAGGISLVDLAKSIPGPLSASIPTGAVDIQVHVPLSDPAPATTMLQHCDELANVFELAKTQTPGACRFALQATNALELDAWVEGKELRLGAHKGPAPAGNGDGMTTVGKELATGDWSAELWGRGTMLNLTGVTPATEDLPPQAALGIHAIALVNELGAALKVEKDSVAFRVYLRTAWANPPEVFAKVVAIGGSEIVKGTATQPAKVIADGAAGSPFAADFKAGQGGLMVPAAAIGLFSAVAIPAFMRYMRGGSGGGDDEQPGGPSPVDPQQLLGVLLNVYVEEAYPQWQAENPKSTACPALADLRKYLGQIPPEVPVDVDPWGHTLHVKCENKQLHVWSDGPDGQDGTGDDVRSW